MRRSERHHLKENVVGVAVVSLQEQLRTWGRGLMIGVVIALGLASIPFVSTVRPDAVIDDPAVMLITLAVLSVITTCETIRRHHVARAAALPAPRRRAGPAMLIPEATSTTRS